MIFCRPCTLSGKVSQYTSGCRLPEIILGAQATLRRFRRQRSFAVAFECTRIELIDEENIGVGIEPHVFTDNGRDRELKDLLQNPSYCDKARARGRTGVVDSR